MRVERDLRDMVNLVEAVRTSVPVPGRLSGPVLEALATLVPSDDVTFADFDVAGCTQHVLDEHQGGRTTFSPAPVHDPDDPFWRLYATSEPCSFSSRTGDERSVTMRSDFLDLAGWRASEMYDVMFRPLGIDHELMCPLPGVQGRLRRVLFFRSGSYGFSERDRAVLTLARPHLVEHLHRRTGSDEALTDRQLEILSLVAQGHSNADVARALHLSPHTVRTHLENAFARLGVTTRAAAVARAFAA
jgi:DNA-binding CsgD family transcriptional regulator